jgi:hypothetical protein
MSKIIASIAGGPCGAAPTCPEVYVLDDGNVLVRGYLPDAATRRQVADLADDEDLVVIPPRILQQLRGQ